jgi:hypothetical protein
VRADLEVEPVLPRAIWGAGRTKIGSTVLPNLVIIGAGKAGTTSLHYYLDQHPEIAMSTLKETHFFVSEDWRDRIDWYQSLFPKSAAVRGEASPSYSTYPRRRGVPERMRELIPEAKLIYMVRDPVDRLVAHYSQHIAAGREERSLERAITESLSNGDRPNNPYLAASSYATQVEQYLGHFPSEQLLVVDQAELAEDRLGTLRSVFDFLGVDRDFSSPRFADMVNTKSDQLSFNRVGRKLRDSRLRHAVRARVPRSVRRPVTKPIARMLSKSVERPSPSPELADALRERLRPEVERLRELTGKPFDRWSV